MRGSGVFSRRTVGTKVIEESLYSRGSVTSESKDHLYSRLSLTLYCTHSLLWDG
jgi:hypothetical protein